MSCTFLVQLIDCQFCCSPTPKQHQIVPPARKLKCNILKAKFEKNVLKCCFRTYSVFQVLRLATVAQCITLCGFMLLTEFLPCLQSTEMNKHGPKTTVWDQNFLGL